MKDSEVIEIVGMIVAAYPSSKLDAASSKIYRTMLVHLPADIARAAVTRLLATSKFAPSIAEIRSAAAELEHGPVRTGAEAYDVVLKAIRIHGPAFGDHKEPTFLDPLIPKCLGVWGTWNDACDSPSNDPGGRARFIELYDELARRQRDAVVSGIALPEPCAPLRLVSGGQEIKATGRRGQLTDGMGGDDARLPGGASRGCAQGTHHADGQLPNSLPQKGSDVSSRADRALVVNLPAMPRVKHQDREHRRFTAEEIDVAMRDTKQAGAGK